jgi:hypothetical protein
MSGIAVLTYHPEIGTFRGKRGAWRVQRYIPAGWWLPAGPVLKVGYDYSKQCKALFMDVARPLRVGTYVNPTKLLREVLAQRRQISQLKEAA